MISKLSMKRGASTAIVAAFLSQSFFPVSQALGQEPMNQDLKLELQRELSQEWMPIQDQGNLDLIQGIVEDVFREKLIPDFTGQNPLTEQIYDDFLLSCRGALDELLLHYELATEEWNVGNDIQAVVILHRALLNEARRLERGRHWDILPHTAMSILQSADIIREVFPIIDQRITFNPRGTSNLNLRTKYILLSSLVKLIKYSDERLDREYASTVADDYFDYYQQNPRPNYPYGRRTRLPQRYFDRFKDLGKLTMDVQRTIREFLADDTVELATMRAIARSTRLALAQSSLRRSFRTVVRDLRLVERLVDHYLGRASGVRSHERVLKVRERMDIITSRIQAIPYNSECP